MAISRHPEFISLNVTLGRDTSQAWIHQRISRTTRFFFAISLVPQANDAAFALTALWSQFPRLPSFWPSTLTHNWFSNNIHSEIYLLFNTPVFTLQSGYCSAPPRRPSDCLAKAWWPSLFLRQTKVRQHQQTASTWTRHAARSKSCVVRPSR